MFNKLIKVNNIEMKKFEDLEFNMVESTQAQLFFENRFGVQICTRKNGLYDVDVIIEDNGIIEEVTFVIFPPEEELCNLTKESVNGYIKYIQELPPRQVIFTYSHLAK